MISLRIILNCSVPGTYTAKAIEKMTTDCFSNGNGNRDDSKHPNIAITITDGEANDGANIPAAATLARDAGIDMYAVAVGAAVSMSYLVRIYLMIIYLYI